MFEINFYLVSSWTSWLLAAMSGGSTSSSSSVYLASCHWAGMVHKKAFKSLNNNSWKVRYLYFDAERFTLSWYTSRAGKETGKEKAKGEFHLDLDNGVAVMDFGPVEEHNKPYETRVAVRDKALYFCPMSADEQNTLLTRMDAARRLKMASVSLHGTVFRDMRETLLMSHPSGVGGEPPGQKVFTWGIGAMLGVSYKTGGSVDGMAVPQSVKALESR